jgi:hypothetical protein
MSLLALIGVVAIVLLVTSPHLVPSWLAVAGAAYIIVMVLVLLAVLAAMGWIWLDGRWDLTGRYRRLPLWTNAVALALAGALGAGMALWKG